MYVCDNVGDQEKPCAGGGQDVAGEADQGSGDTGHVFSGSGLVPQVCSFCKESLRWTVQNVRTRSSRNAGKPKRKLILILVSSPWNVLPHTAAITQGEEY